MRRFIVLSLLFSCATLGFSAESLQERIKQTDMNDPDQVYALGIWCEENRKPTSARKYFAKVLQLDPDHGPTRSKFGQVKVGDHWVREDLVNGGNKDSDDGKPGSSRKSSSPGPTASEVKWDLTIPEIKQENPFLEEQIMRMQKNANDSNDMDSATLTLYREDNRVEMVPLLCKALSSPNFTDLYGTSLIILKYIKEGDIETPRLLLNFLAKTSERCKDGEDLEMFAYITPLIKDRRIVPRLIELMGHSEKRVSSAARSAFAQLTLNPDDESLTQAKALAWWNLNHDASPKVYLSEQLRSSDPMISISAAEGLYQFRDPTVLPAIFKVLKGDDRQAIQKAILLMTKITGNDWGYTLEAKPEDRAKIVKQMEDWWKKDGKTFEWIEDRNKPEVTATGVTAAPTDPFAGMVGKLASFEGTEAQQAEQNLLNAGDKAVPALIVGLSNQSVIIRRKSNDILKMMSKKDVGYDPRAEEAARSKAIAAWQAWAIDKGALNVGESEGK